MAHPTTLLLRHLQQKEDGFYQCRKQRYELAACARSVASAVTYFQHQKPALPHFPLQQLQAYHQIYTFHYMLYP
jgi:hypothetical protein